MHTQMLMMHSTKIEGNSTMNCFKFPEMEISDEELADASADSDTAIYVISRNAGEGTDRTLKGTKGTSQRRIFMILVIII